MFSYANCFSLNFCFQIFANELSDLVFIKRIALLACFHLMQLMGLCNTIINCIACSKITCFASESLTPRSSLLSQSLNSESFAVILVTLVHKLNTGIFYKILVLVLFIVILNNHLFLLSQ